jgi:serine/threonine-protein kinase
MGEVYRARDPRMGREVAIKLSAEHFSDRFEREVRAVAALNHANICQVYDVGPNYLVMELIEGLTLSERIKGGALPLEEALVIARQIGDALEAAHEKGIIHRDLKPANIKLRPDGTIKVLDFGLAKINEPASATGNPEESPTIPMGATLAGQIMGTAAYMAPEQARGKAVDKRADIWAFGVVLFEMLTGRKLFEGETISDILAGVLTKDPDWQRAPAKAQPLLKRCLEKDPKRRLRDIGDAWQLVEDRPALDSRESALIWKAGAGILTVALAVALWAPWSQNPQGSEREPVELDLDLGGDASLVSPIGAAVILSPDGGRLVFVSNGQDGKSRLFTRGLKQRKANVLAKTEGAYAPFFSPDGLWVGFFADGKLKKTRIDGGEPIALCDAPAGRGASWGENGFIVAQLASLAGLSIVSVEGGTPSPLTELTPKEISHRWPQLLPGSQNVLFVAASSYGSMDPSEISVVSLKDKGRKTVLDRAGIYPRYLASGHLLFVTKGSLFAVSFDAKRLEARGAPVKLGEVSANPTLASAQYDISSNGLLAYVVGISEKLRTIQWIDGAGRTEPLVSEPALYGYPRVAPDGIRVAVIGSQGVGGDVFIYNQERGGKIRLTNQMTAAYPTWSPDGQFIVFTAPGGLFWTRSDGAGQPQPLTHGERHQVPGSFTPDGARLIFSEIIPGGGAELRVVHLDVRSGVLRAGEPQSLLKTATVEGYAAVAPNGKWIAYADAEGGTYEVYVRAFPDKGTRVLVSNAGGMIPVWSGNGRELFYRTEDHRIMAVSYTTKGDVFIPEKPRLWSTKQLANMGTGRNYDLAPDGNRCVVLTPADSGQPRETQSHVNLVVNFFDEVRRRVEGQAK